MTQITMTADREQAEKKRRRRPLRDVLLACIVVLLLAQGLIGSLSLSALNRLAADNTAERIELLARRTSSQIQTGMTLGKPLAQYFGLSSLLDELRRSEEHTSELQSLMRNSYAVFCLKKKKK